MAYLLLLEFLLQHVGVFGSLLPLPRGRRKLAPQRLDLNLSLHIEQHFPIQEWTNLAFEIGVLLKANDCNQSDPLPVLNLGQRPHSRARVRVAKPVRLTAPAASSLSFSLRNSSSTSLSPFDVCAGNKALFAVLFKLRSDMMEGELEAREGAAEIESPGAIVDGRRPDRLSLGLEHVGNGFIVDEVMWRSSCSSSRGARGARSAVFGSDSIVGRLTNLNLKD